MKKWIVLLLLVGCLPGRAEEPADTPPKEKKAEENKKDHLAEAAKAFVEMILLSWKFGAAGAKMLEKYNVEESKAEAKKVEESKDEAKKVEESKAEAKKVEEPKAPPIEWKDSAEYQEKIKELREKSSKKTDE